MSEEGPKLYTNKPKKAQLLKHLKEMQKAQDSSSTFVNSATSAAASYKTGPPPPPPPPPPPQKEPFVRRFKFLWPMLLAVNLAVGAYLFTRTKKKDTDIEEEVPSNVPSTSLSTSAVTETSTPLPPVSVPGPVLVPQLVKPREPIPENEQRQLFKWMLEEKRKIKPKDAEEKKRLDEEKAILKQFMRAKSIPSI